METTDNKYQPKGSMCANCLHAPRGCDHLEFDKMPVIKKDGDCFVVKCIDFKKDK